MSDIILVTGATGKQGGSVIAGLLALQNKGSNFKIRTISRSPDSTSALSLASSGVEVVKGDFNDPKSLERALVGVKKAFLVTTIEGGKEKEEKNGKLFVDLAKKAGVEYLVFTSVASADAKTGIPHFESKNLIEEYIKNSGLRYTFLRPVAFYDNLPKVTGIQTFFMLGLYDAALHGRKIQMIACEDIGFFAARALNDPEKYNGRIISLAGDDINMSQAQDAYAVKNGGVRPWKAWLPSLVLYALPYDLRIMFNWFYKVGYNIDIDSLRQEHPGLLTFEQWVLKDDKKNE